MSPAPTPDLTDVPDQTGRTALVTGTTVGGLGFHVALELARHGADVVLAGRTAERLQATTAAIRDEVPQARLGHLVVDLADLGSVRHAAATAVRAGPVHLLVNNAGVMGVPRRELTPDGLERQLATNHLGPFLLTGLLLPQLVAGDARVVTVSSQFHRMARRAPLDDPRTHRGRYQPWTTYARTKLANLLFTAELDRRCLEAGLPVRALAAHPGFAGTHLAANGRFGRAAGGVASVLDGAVRAISQPPAAGALPVLAAATADLPGGSYVGPGGPGELSGPPRLTTGSALSRDPEVAGALWELSQEVTGVVYP